MSLSIRSDSSDSHLNWLIRYYKTKTGRVSPMRVLHVVDCPDKRAPSFCVACYCQHAFVPVPQTTSPSPNLFTMARGLSGSLRSTPPHHLPASLCCPPKLGPPGSQAVGPSC
eukprot:4188756-Pyramimonas_sp.AAC.1